MAKKRRIVYTNRPWEATGICSGCRLCELYCSLQANGAFNPYRSRVRVVEMATGIDIPVTCQQCPDPACQTACEFDAIVFDTKLKIVVVSEENCTSSRPVWVPALTALSQWIRLATRQSNATFVVTVNLPVSPSVLPGYSVPWMTWRLPNITAAEPLPCWQLTMSFYAPDQVARIRS